MNQFSNQTSVLPNNNLLGNPVSNKIATLIINYLAIINDDNYILYYIRNGIHQPIIYANINQSIILIISYYNELFILNRVKLIINHCTGDVSVLLEMFGAG